MSINKIIPKKIENFIWELAQDYLAFFYNPSLKKHHLKEIIQLISYRYFKVFPSLSTQEIKCLYLAGKGKSIKETAQILNIDYETAREYRDEGIKSIGATNITEASVKFYE